MFFFKKKERTNYGKIFAVTVAIVAATCAVACAVSCVVCKLLGKYLSFGVCEDDYLDEGDENEDENCDVCVEDSDEGAADAE